MIGRPAWWPKGLRQLGSSLEGFGPIGKFRLRAIFLRNLKPQRVSIMIEAWVTEQISISNCL